jgi:hypothetical protein
MHKNNNNKNKYLIKHMEEQINYIQKFNKKILNNKFKNIIIN